MQRVESEATVIPPTFSELVALAIYQVDGLIYASQQCTAVPFALAENLVAKGWLERSGKGPHLAYSITEAGLAALRSALYWTPKKGTVDYGSLD